MYGRSSCEYTCYRPDYRTSILYLYIRAKNWSDKDEFELYSDGDYYDLVEEAKNMEQ